VVLAAAVRLEYFCVVTLKKCISRDQIMPYGQSQELGITKKIILNQNNCFYSISTQWEILNEKNLYFNCINIFWEITKPKLSTNYKYDRPVI